MEAVAGRDQMKLVLQREKQGIEEKLSIMKKRKKLVMRHLNQLALLTKEEETDTSAKLVVDADIQKASKKKVCSFCVTGHSKATQLLASCETW